MYLCAGFGVGAMIHAVLHFGMYFELRSTSKCDDILVAITPLAQAAFILTQMIFIFSDNNKVRGVPTVGQVTTHNYNHTAFSLSYKVCQQLDR
jgi:hypothetical protein